MRVNDIGLQAPQQRAQRADRLRIPEREPGAKSFGIGGVKMIGWNAVTDFFKGCALCGRDYVRIVPSRLQAAREPPDHNFGATHALWRDEIA